MKKVIFLFVLALLQVSMFAQSKWAVDKGLPKVGLIIIHLVISEVDGFFKTYSGTMTSGKTDFTDATITFTVDVKSICTDNEMRDTHLKSTDFFDAEKFPQMTFKSTSLKKTGNGSNYLLSGNLTMHGMTKIVKFEVTYGRTYKDGVGQTRAGFKATTKINRLDYGINWNKKTEGGGATVGDNVTINLKLDFIQAK